MAGDLVARVQCPTCGATFRLKQVNLGRNVKCSKCNNPFLAREIAEASKPMDPLFSNPVPPQPVPTQPVQHRPIPNQHGAPRPTAGMRRCDRCHEMIPEQNFAAHRKSHEGVRADGQLNEYPTLPPEERFQGDLSNVPMWYKHKKCGAVTGMPEEIVRTYLVNPYFYAYKTYCSGCQTHVSMKELNWESTGQNLMEYTRQLQAANPNRDKLRNKTIMTILGVGFMGGLLLGTIGGGITIFLASMLIAFSVFIVCTIIGTALTAILLLNMRGGI